MSLSPDVLMGVDELGFTKLFKTQKPGKIPGFL